MSENIINRVLEKRGWILADGGIGTQLFDMGLQAGDAGAKIIGGCCGTTPIHLASMRRALENHKTSEKPSIEKVVENLGPLSSDFDGTEDSNDQPKRKSKRKHKE